MASSAVWRAFLLSFPLFISCQFAEAECSRPNDGSIKANPNRPTVADPADVTQVGVVETEFGWTRTWDRDRTYGTDIGNLIKYSVLCDLEFRWNATLVTGEEAQGRSDYGVGDNFVGFQWRVLHQRTRVPTLALGYAAKIPTASTAKGLGSGRTDHVLKFLASKDIAGFHFDFNTAYILVGRGLPNGYDNNYLITLSGSHALKGPFSITGELYGFTRLNAASPGFASNLWALLYTLNPRLVFDAGIDAGLTSGAPHKRIFAGFTYSILDLNSTFGGRASR